MLSTLLHATPPRTRRPRFSCLRSGIGPALAAWMAALGAGCDPGPPAPEVWHRVDEAALPEALEQPRPGTRPVTLEPAGTWHVAAPPQKLVTYQGIETDMVWLLGAGDRQQAMVYRDRYARLNERFFRQVPGFNVSLEGVAELAGGGAIGKEILYRLDPDAFLIDPRLPLVYWKWRAEDLEEVASKVAPFFGNFIRKRRTRQWGPPYRQHTMDEVLAAYATLLDRTARYRRFAAFRDALLARIERALPPPAARPEIMLVNAASEPEKGKFHLVDLPPPEPGTFAGTWVQPYRELGLQPAYDFDRYAMNEQARVDYEVLAAIDPEVIVVVWSLARFPSQADFEREFLEPMREHPVGRSLRAVRSDRVLPGGTAEQGPLTHLFQLEMMAKLIFPETFGGWEWGRTPPEPLFDRAELGRILTGGEAP